MQKERPTPDVRLVFHPESDPTYVHFADHAQAPFDASAPAMTRANAWWLSEAALLSYWDETEAVARFARAGLQAELLEAGDTQAYVAWSERVVFVSFRGTETGSMGDIVDDSRLLLVPWSHGHVHRGFKGALDRIWASLATTLQPLATTRSVWFSGHSLGAALATLAADRFEETAGVCTLGSPRVGDTRFAQHFDARFAARAVRYINDTDIVCHVPTPFPLPYKHVGSVRQIAPDGSISTQRVLPHFVPAVFGRLEHLQEVSDAIRMHVIKTAPDFLLDHMPRAYTVDIWNDFDLNSPW